MNADEKLPVIFRNRFLSALPNSPWRSWRQVAKDSENSASLLQGIARGEYDKSSKGPGIFTMYRAARTLGVSLDYLAPPQDRPNTAEFLAPYEGKQTPIAKFGPMLDFCDVYSEPEGGSTHIARLGPRSLLVERSGTNDAALLQIEYENWSSARRRKIFERQRRAWENGILTEPELFDVPFVHNSTDVRVSFLLSICRVVDFDGTKRLLIFCEPTPQQR